MRRLVVLAVAAWGAGCGRPGAPAPSPPVPSAPVPSAAATAAAPAGEAAPGAEEAPPAPAAVPPAVAEALADMARRARCNRVMGCRPAVALMQQGRAAVPALVGRLEEDGTRDGYDLLMALELLGQLDDDRALPALERSLRDGRWEVRARAALALARLARPSSRDALAAARERAAEAGDLPLLGAALLGLERTGGRAGDASPREALRALYAGLDRDTLGRANPGHLAFLARLVREARLPDALPVARLLATHVDRFVRLEALQTLGALQDTGGIAFAVERLEDPLPSVRGSALEALRAITGSRELTSPDEWRAWCEQRDCLTALRGATPPPAPAAGPEPDAVP